MRGKNLAGKHLAIKQNRTTRIYICTILILLGLILMNLCFGSAHLTLSEVWTVLINGTKETAAGRIFWYARLPRTIACVLAGSAFAVSGSVIQAVLTNQLASPSVIGVNAGAGLAVTICCALGVYSGWAIAGVSFLGAMLTVLTVAFAAEKIGASRTTILLGGVAVNSCLNAAAEAISILLPDAGMQAADFRVGGFSAVVYSRLFPAGLLIVLGLILLLTLCNELDVISLGEETAQGLGLPVKKMRALFLIVAALLAGAAVSFAGLIGFVGLIVPHVTRTFVTSESGKQLPLCALSGAGLVLFCDLAARTLFAPYEIPVGILLSCIGGPFFIFLLIRKKGGHST